MEIVKGLTWSFYILFHPFDGSWSAKNEKKGNVKSASVILFLVILYYILSRQLTGFVFNAHSPDTLNIFSESIGILAPFFMWCAANWSITTLLDGEGSFKDIYIASAYALVPIIIVGFPMILISNYIVLEERSIYTALEMISVAWAAFLMFAGLLTIHQYTVRKTILTILIAIIGMVAMLFLFLLFFALLQQLLNFLYIAYIELLQRLL